MFASRFARNAAKSFRLKSTPFLRRSVAIGSALSLTAGAVFAHQSFKRSQDEQENSFIAEALKAVLPVANAEAAKTAAQSAVYSGGKNHAGYLWLRLSDQADVAKIASLVAKVPELAASFAPKNEKGEVDEDEEVLVSVAFGPGVASKLGLKPPKDFAYQTRSGPVGDMPATGGDVFIHIKSNTQSNVFDLAQQIHQLIPGAWAKSFEDRYGFVYRRGRDLSGFIDGTENPASEDDRYDAAVIPETGGSFVLTQRWVHHRTTNEVHEVKAQEQFVGRTKDNSVALNPLPATSHVARMTGHDASGKKMNIVRQSMPYGDLRGESGLFFIAYFKDPAVINYMLDRMTGTGTATDKKHDDIMRFSRCVDGNVWYVPSPAELASLKK